MSGETPSFPDAVDAPQTPYEKLHSAILAGQLSPGAPLVEVRVAEWCGVSRTPIREAFLRLEHDGLIERTDRGFVVKKRSPEGILDIYEVRISLEAMAARFAAERATRLDLRRMEGLAKAADGVEVERAVEHNGEFHRAIWTASHNDALIELLERLNAQLTRYPATTLTYPGRWQVAIGEHRALLDAILAHDPEGASAAAVRHFEAAREIRLKLFEDGVV